MADHPLLGAVVSSPDSERVVLTGRLAVRDTGPGITPAEQQRIFEPYYRGVTATRGAEAGVGLGLALARDLARWLGTELVVDGGLTASTGRS